MEHLTGSYAQVTVGGTTLKVPVIIQPGQAKGTVGLAFGYGKKSGLQEEMQDWSKCLLNSIITLMKFKRVQHQISRW